LFLHLDRPRRTIIPELSVGRLRYNEWQWQGPSEAQTETARATLEIAVKTLLRNLR